MVPSAPIATFARGFSAKTAIPSTTAKRILEYLYGVTIDAAPCLYASVTITYPTQLKTSIPTPHPNHAVPSLLLGSSGSPLEIDIITPVIL